MSNIGQNIAEATDILITKRLGDLKLDQTIIGTIYSVTDSSQGIYEVEYQSQIFTAYVENTIKTYRKGDNVYIKIPSSDFSNKKFIEGRIGQNAQFTESQMQNIKNYFLPASPRYHFLNNEPIGIEAGEENQIENIETIVQTRKIVWENDMSELEQLQFYNLSQQYKIIKLEATFITHLINANTTGNYGLIFTFGVSEIEKVEYRLSIEHFVGSPFSFNTGAEQYRYIQIDSGMLKSLEKIELFQEMAKDMDVNNVQNPYQRISGEENIYVQDIKLSFFEVLDLSNQDYYLQLNAYNGYQYDDNIEKLSFDVELIHNGVNVVNEDVYKVTWYKAKNKIDENGNISKAQFQEWEIIEEGKSLQVLDLPLNNNTVDYKVIIYHNNSSLVEKEFNITHIDTVKPQFKYGMIEDGIYTISITDEKSFGVWEYEGQEIKEKTELLNSISIPTFLFTKKTLEVRCWVYDKDKQKYLGFETITLELISEEKDIEVDFNCVDSYQYDINGDLKLDEAKRERFIKPVLKFRDGVSAQITEQVFWIGEQKITEDKQQIKNSMLEDVYCKDNVLYYTLNSKYDSAKNNNIITLQLITQSNKEYKYTKEIKFTKVGSTSVSNNSFTCRLWANNDKFYKFLPEENNYTLQLEIFNNGNKLSIEQIESEHKIQLNSFKFNAMEINNGEKEQYELYNPEDEYVQGDIVRVNYSSTNQNSYYQYIHSFASVSKSMLDQILKALVEQLEYEEEIPIDASSYYDQTPGLLMLQNNHFITKEEFMACGELINSKHIAYIVQVYSDIILTDMNPTSEKIENKKYWQPIKIEQNNSNLLYELLEGVWQPQKDKVDAICNIIETQINIDSNIYDLYFPIILAFGEIDNIKETIPTTVKYSSSGNNPTYFQQPNKNEELSKQPIEEIKGFKVYNLYNFNPPLNYNYSLANGNKYYVEALIRYKLEEGIKLLAPVIYYLDTYGNNSVNDQSGTVIEGENDTLQAFDIISGTKDSEGRLTGLIVGKSNVDGEGMYGYQTGVNTFGLKADGTAYFGSSKNIQINGTEAKIVGNGGTGSMTLDLTANNSSEKAIDIKYNNQETFYVTYDGKAYLSGTINATSGKIGNWEINQGSIRGKDSKTVLSSEGVINTQYLTINNSQGELMGQLGQQEAGYFGLTAIKGQPIYLQSSGGIYINSQSLQDYIKGVINGTVN